MAKENAELRAVKNTLGDRPELCPIRIKGFPLPSHEASWLLSVEDAVALRDDLDGLIKSCDISICVDEFWRLWGKMIWEDGPEMDSVAGSLKRVEWDDANMGICRSFLILLQRLSPSDDEWTGCGSTLKVSAVGLKRWIDGRVEPLEFCAIVTNEKEIMYQLSQL